MEKQAMTNPAIRQTDGNFWCLTHDYKNADKPCPHCGVEEDTTTKVLHLGGVKGGPGPAVAPPIPSNADNKPQVIKGANLVKNERDIGALALTPEDHEGAMNDLRATGQAFLKDGKHIPAETVFVGQASAQTPRYVCLTHDHRGMEPCPMCPQGTVITDGTDYVEPKHVEKPIDWPNVKVSLVEPLTPHEILLGDVVAAQNIEEINERSQILLDRVKADGGWYKGRKMRETAKYDFEPGDVFSIKCQRCGKEHRGVIEQSPINHRVTCIGKIVCDA